jgi:hypothetical protein
MASRKILGSHDAPPLPPDLRTLAGDRVLSAINDRLNGIADTLIELRALVLDVVNAQNHINGSLGEPIRTLRTEINTHRLYLAKLHDEANGAEG